MDGKPSPSARHFHFQTLRRTLLVLFFVGGLNRVGRAYSVLTHEEIIDLLWADHMKPLLIKKYPGVTPEQLKEAHSFAYGGSLVQDIGYYPFGNVDFSDLTHYVRTGDFVMALLDESKDVNDYAFGLGALSHYISDVTGHPLVNAAVASEFPKLKAKYGDHVTYAQNPRAHLRTEFGFDVAQVAKKRYTPDSYHDFIGFQVATPVLERAFRKTYGLEMRDLFTNLNLSVGTFRRAVSKTIPEMTRVALITRKKELNHENPNFTKQKFLYHLSRADYERAWGKTYQRPNVAERLLAFLIILVPKVGPFKALAFKLPTPETEDLYFKSVNETVEHYRVCLQQLRTGTLSLNNRDYDTGRTTKAGEYTLADEAYEMLVGKLAKDNFALVTPDLRKELLDFFSGPSPAVPANPATGSTKKDALKWQKALESLEPLKSNRPR